MPYFVAKSNSHVIKMNGDSSRFWEDKKYIQENSQPSRVFVQGENVVDESVRVSKSIRQKFEIELGQHNLFLKYFKSVNVGTGSMHYYEKGGFMKPHKDSVLPSFAATNEPHIATLVVSKDFQCMRIGENQIRDDHYYRETLVCFTLDEVHEIVPIHHTRISYTFPVYGELSLETGSSWNKIYKNTVAEAELYSQAVLRVCKDFKRTHKRLPGYGEDSTSELPDSPSVLPDQEVVEMNRFHSDESSDEDGGIEIDRFLYNILSSVDKDLGKKYKKGYRGKLAVEYTLQNEKHKDIVNVNTKIPDYATDIKFYISPVLNEAMEILEKRISEAQKKVENTIVEFPPFPSLKNLSVYETFGTYTSSQTEKDLIESDRHLYARLLEEAKNEVDVVFFLNLTNSSDFETYRLRNGKWEKRSQYERITRTVSYFSYDFNDERDYLPSFTSVYSGFVIVKKA